MRRLVRAAVGGRRDVRARRGRRRRRRTQPGRRALVRRALQVLLRGLLQLPAVPARLPAGPGRSPVLVAARPHPSSRRLVNISTAGAALLSYAIGIFAATCTTALQISIYIPCGLCKTTVV